MLVFVSPYLIRYNIYSFIFSSLLSLLIGTNQYWISQNMWLVYLDRYYAKIYSEFYIFRHVLMRSVESQLNTHRKLHKWLDKQHISGPGETAALHYNCLCFDTFLVLILFSEDFNTWLLLVCLFNKNHSTVYHFVSWRQPLSSCLNLFSGNRC